MHSFVVEFDSLKYRCENLKKKCKKILILKLLKIVHKYVLESPFFNFWANLRQ
jgi:hypothetical protein